MNCLITGGAGYIGSVCADLLLHAGHTVSVIDDLRQGNADAVPDGAVFYHAQYGEKAVLHEVFDRHIDVVFHLAAEASVPRSMHNPGLFYEVNVCQGLSLLETMRHHGCRILIFSSTAAVFGEPITVPIDEHHPKNPCNPYGDSKLAFERLLRWYHECYGFRAHIFRYFNAAGATERHGESRPVEEHLIPRAFEALTRKRNQLTVFGNDYPTRDGTCVRDYLHVRDVAQAHLVSAEYLLQHDECDDFNLGSGTGTTVLELLDAIQRVTGRPVPYTIGGRRAGDPAVLVASSDKARQKLGLTFEHSTVDQIVSSAWRWVRKAG